MHILCFYLIGCSDNNEYIEYTVEKILSEYSANPKEFIKNFKNKKIILDGVIGYASQPKEHSGNRYYVIFDCETFDENDESPGFYVSCGLKSYILGHPRNAKGKHIKVKCEFNRVIHLKNPETVEIDFHFGHTVSD